MSDGIIISKNGPICCTSEGRAYRHQFGLYHHPDFYGTRTQLPNAPYRECIHTACREEAVHVIWWKQHVESLCCCSGSNGIVIIANLKSCASWNVCTYKTLLLRLDVAAPVLSWFNQAKLVRGRRIGKFSLVTFPWWHNELKSRKCGYDFAGIIPTRRRSW